ncbi:MAG: HDIG domain-containing protein [Anaerolineales bacterium]|nr:HDIG domain-containing protein [Anaerolineales bacterium]MCX7755064.1 HDIG domain-containing protein [Anaerolineales bacterium]MDW8277583.1 HDIG domain-containing protein [Anaerolineales bacterium]
MNQPPRWWQQVSRHDFFALLLLLLTGVAAYAILILPVSVSGTTLPVRVGQVAAQDYTAPANGEYISDVRTSLARDAAERAVAPIYTSPDPAIARRQVARLRAALERVDLIRADPNLSLEQKREALNAIDDLTLRPQTIEAILALSDSRWSTTGQDALRVLESVMRGAVREENIAVLQSNLPSLVSFALSEEQAAIVVEIVTPFIVPNSFYSPELTNAARQKARQSVEPVTQTYVAGEVVVRRGKALTETDIEALEKLGLIRPRNTGMEYLGGVAAVSVTTILVAFYFQRRRPSYYYDGRSLLLIAILFLLFLAAARLVIPDRTLLPYVFPIPAFGLLMTTLFSPGGGLVLSVALSVLAAFGQVNALELTLFYLLTSLLGVYSLGKAHRISTFLWAALVVGLTGIAVLVAYRITKTNIDWLGYFQLIGACLLNGVASASLALMLQYLLAEFLGLTTTLRLLEISRPDSPLLQFFLRSAPGTYQHSLMVSNLAEQAAERLGLDTLLVRVGALYHDVGKAVNAPFFIENQLPDNLNPHHDLDPDAAAQLVVRHVTDGVNLARKYRLPQRIVDFMLEHHGTLLARYHYNLALQAAGGDKSKVDEAKFRYPGPPPRSRETALLMLADHVEARARSERPRTEEQIRELVRKSIEFCQREGQLDDTQLTFRDLTVITEAFVTTLLGQYHPRIQYPAAESPAPAEPASSLPKPAENS